MFWTEWAESGGKNGKNMGVGVKDLAHRTSARLPLGISPCPSFPKSLAFSFAHVLLFHPEDRGSLFLRNLRNIPATAVLKQG